MIPIFENWLLLESIIDNSYKTEGPFEDKANNSIDYFFTNRFNSSYKINFHENSKNVYDASFGIVDESGELDVNLLTNQGDALKVINTFIKTVIDITNEYHIKSIEIYGIGKDKRDSIGTSRARIYYEILRKNMHFLQEGWELNKTYSYIELVNKNF